MRRALALARDAAAFASPNPTVGCVLVRDGKVLGEGAHFYEARDHAEIAALKQAASLGHDVRGATAYVTLEPCSHHGRTGPCADALAVAGIARCVVATVDPNPVVRGSGLAKLRAAGVDVEVFVAGTAENSNAMYAEDRHVREVAWKARRLNDAFAFAIQKGQPFVTLKAAVSVDGMLAPPPRTRSGGMPHWLTGEAARADVQRQRHANDAILTGVGTVLADDPGMTDRTGLPRRRPLLRVVLDTALRMPLNSQLVNSAASDLLLVCGDSADVSREAELRSRGVEVVRLPVREARVDLVALLAMLFERAIRSVLLETGSSLNGEFLRQNLVDRAVLYYAPTKLGLGAVPFAQGAGSPYLLQQRLSDVERVTFPHGADEDVRMSGYLHDPWTGVQ